MNYCVKCVMPDTRPGLTFDDEGVCSACRAYERRKEIDWEKRYEELKALCDRHRNTGPFGYDCMIAVSGGKDSHFQTHVMKERMGMNPLLVSVEDNGSSSSRMGILRTGPLRAGAIRVWC